MLFHSVDRHAVKHPSYREFERSIFQALDSTTRDSLLRIKNRGRKRRR